MSDVILAVDIGSSSVRAAICDRFGTVIAGMAAKAEYQFTRTGDGGATLMPEAVCETVFGCIDRVLAAYDGPVTAVAVDTFVSSLLGVDAAGQPVTPLYTWADGRGSALMPALRARIEAETYRQRTGCHLHPSYWPLRLTWLREAEPEAFARAHGWLSLGAYLYLRIFGRRTMSISDAAWTGLLDRQTLTWDAPTLTALEISADALPDLHREQHTPEMRENFARRWPQLVGATWPPAIGDGIAANIGAGCTQPHQVAITVGTSGAMRALVTGTPENIPAGLFCYRVDSGRSLVGGAVSNGGSVHHWLQNTLRFDTPPDAQIAAMSPDAHGLTVVPFLSPERSPYWDDTLPSAIIGMTPATTPADILRASLESVAYGFGHIAARLLPLLPENVQFTANGGAAAQSPVLMQMLADVIGHPVALAAQPEATLRGAALALRGEPAPAEPPSAVYHPNPAHSAIYAAAMSRQTRLIDALRR